MICQICGNERSVASSVVCPYCGGVSEEQTEQKSRTFVHKTVNLEAGRPVVEVAINRCREVIDDAILNKINVITFIHGYGSSGKGGAIRSECRKILDYMKSKRIISDYVAGEEFHKRSGRVRMLLQRYSQLTRDRNLNQGNQGITLVIL
ncbi:MAG: Smr/MutS family protein [Pseudomonadota bacterium]